MGVSNIGQADPACVRGEPEVKSGFHLVDGQIGDGMARVFGDLAVTDPGSYEFEMVLAVDTGQLSENVGTNSAALGLTIRSSSSTQMTVGTLLIAYNSVR